MVEELTLRHQGSRSQQHRQELEDTDKRQGWGQEALLALERGPMSTGNSRAGCGRLWSLRDTSVAQAAVGSGWDI